MKKSDQLKQERAEKVKAQGDLLTKAKTENRDLNVAETATFDTLDGEIAALDANIERAIKLEAAELRAAGLEGAEPLNLEPRKPKAKRAFSINKAIRALLDGSELDGPELEANNAGKEAARAAGVGLSPGSFAVPMFSARADGQTVTEDSGDFGGNTVATEMQSPIDFLRPKPVVESLGAVFLTGLQGNLQFPKNNGGVTATWEGEVDEVENTKTAFGKIEMKPWRLAVSVLVSLQNLMQSSFAMEVYTMGEIRKAVENEIDKVSFIGAGATQPLGVLNTSGTNSVAIGINGGPLTFAKAIDMETEVFIDNANAARMNYVSNSKVRGKAKQTVKESGQAIYLLQDNEINGYPYVNSNHIPSNLTKGTASGVCSAMVFGDFSKLVVGQWGFMDLSVDDKSRKKEGYIEITANVYLDVAVLEPKAFAVCKDITT
jgi:HK97 family phage major capsid protein